MTDLVFTPAYQLTQAIHDRQIKAQEVVDAFLVQIARYNSSLNAIVTLDENGARERARAADDDLARGKVWGPLHGVPITLRRWSPNPRFAFNLGWFSRIH